MESTCPHVSKAPESQTITAVTEDTDASKDPEPQEDSIPLAGSVTQNGIHVQVDGREALDLSLFETPRAEDNQHREHQRIHAINVSHRPWKDAVDLPLYDAKMSRTWKPPPSREGTFTVDYLVPVREQTALSLRLFNVAQNSTYKYKVFAGDVNVAAPRPTCVRTLASPNDESDQDYFIAPTQEWVHGIRFAHDPRVVRQFQVLEGDSGLCLASIFPQDKSTKYIEIQIISRKAHGIMKTPGCLESDLQAPESPHSHKAHDKLAHSPEDGPSALTDARVEKVAIRESAEQDSVRQFLVQPRYISTTFHLRLRTWDRDPILVRNVNGSDTVYDLKMKIQYQHGIPLHLQEVCLPERNLHDDFPLAWHGISGTTKDLLLLYHPGRVVHAHSARSCFRSTEKSEKSARRQRLMDICPGGLVTQNFTPDSHPEQWNECYEGSIRIHLIDEKHFESEAGLKLEAKKASECGKSTFFVDEYPRPFIQDPGRGIPSVAEMYGSKARPKPSSSPIPTRKNRKGRNEGKARGEPDVNWTIGKMIRYLFSCSE